MVGAYAVERLSQSVGFKAQAHWHRDKLTLMINPRRLTILFGRPIPEGAFFSR